MQPAAGSTAGVDLASRQRRTSAAAPTQPRRRTSPTDHQATSWSCPSTDQDHQSAPLINKRSRDNASTRSSLIPGHQVSHHPQDRCAASADARRRSAAIRCRSLASCGNSPPEKDWKDEASQSRLRAMTASP